MQQWFTRILVVAAPFAVLPLPLPAYAQAGADAGVEEIVVSARRRDEGIQEVPVSVQALTGDQMETRGIERLDNVIASAPNVVISSSTSGQAVPQFSIRGIPGAGIFVDGVFQQSFVGIGQRSVAEIERVEVLRGPQGTLFGRDTTGGAIRIFTQLPADEFGVRTTATVGSYNRRDISLNADLPFSDTLKSKFTFASEQRDGYVKSIITGRATGEIDDRALRADFLWKPTDQFDARLTLEDSRSRSTQPNYTLHIFDPGEPGIDPGLGFQIPMHQYYVAMGVPYDCQNNVPGCPGGRVGDLETVDNYNGPPGVRVDEGNYNLHLTYHFNDNISLYSLTNFNDLKSWHYINFDAAPVDYFSQGTYAERESWSEELQLSGDFGRIRWVSGLYAWNTNVKDRFYRWALWDWDEGGGPNPRFSFADLRATEYCANPDPSVVPCVRLPFLQANPYDMAEEEQEGWAVFGELTFDITDTLAVTLGGRYHDQTNKNWVLIPAPDTPGLADIPGHLVGGGYQLANLGRTEPTEDSFEKDTYRLVLSNQFSDTLMAYASFSQGYNAGGVARVRLPNLEADYPYDPETIDSYEIGVRSDWLEGRLRVNATLFKTEWEDIQLDGTVRDPATGAILPTFIRQNAAAAEAEGMELSVIYRPIDQLLINFDAGFLDTGYTSISDSVSDDLSADAKFGRAPERQFSGGIQWINSVGSTGYELLLRTDYNYTSGYMRHYIPGDQSTSFTGEKWEVPAFGLLQARAVLTPPDARWELSVFGSNLTDERYSTGGFMSPLLQIDDGTVGRPREWGMSIRFEFE